jgi:hypothetical protein
VIHGFLKLNVWRPLFAEFVNSTGKFNSIVVKTLKPVFCSSRDGVPLKLKKQT